MLKFLSYRLQPEDLELRFRRDILPQNKFQVIVIMGFSVFVLAGSALIDLIFLESSIPILGSVASRLTTLVIFLAGMWILRFQDQVHMFDRIVLVLTLAILTNMIIVDYVMSGAYATIVAWDIISIFVIYLAVPLQLPKQAPILVIFTAFSAGNWLVFRAPVWTSLETAATIAAYIVINILGIFLSFRNNSARRQQFVLLQNELAAKIKLEKALNEVNQLRGIIPICAACKKVKESEGYWKQVEAYIEDHSDAEFSHGLCEECADKLYGDKKWYRPASRDERKH